MISFDVGHRIARYENHSALKRTAFSNLSFQAFFVRQSGRRTLHATQTATTTFENHEAHHWRRTAKICETPGSQKLVRRGFSWERLNRCNTRFLPKPLVIHDIICMDAEERNPVPE